MSPVLAGCAFSRANINSRANDLSSQSKTRASMLTSSGAQEPLKCFSSDCRKATQSSNSCHSIKGHAMLQIVGHHSQGLFLAGFIVFLRIMALGHPTEHPREREIVRHSLSAFPVRKKKGKER